MAELTYEPFSAALRRLLLRLPASELPIVTQITPSVASPRKAFELHVPVKIQN